MEIVTELFINYWKSNVNNFHVRKIKGGAGEMHTYIQLDYSRLKNQSSQPFHHSAADL